MQSSARKGPRKPVSERSMPSVDVTEYVIAGFPDDEIMPVEQCVCGQKYDPWEQMISIYEEHATVMPCCGARLYWKPCWKVMSIK